MSSEVAIRVAGISKCYHIYERPGDRLKQFIYPRLQRLTGRVPAAYYREFWALQDISFAVQRGETVGIIGRNGSGKSTLLQIICGTTAPTGGRLATHGRVAALLELGSGFNPEFTGRENVYMNAAVLGLSKEEIDARFADIADFADIGNFIEQPVKTYSSGMMVRLAFAVIAHVDADILVIDEALAVGDAFFTRKCMRFLRKFMAGGTVLFVSHDTGSIKSLCKHVIWLEKGRIVRQGPPKEVCEAYLEAFYEEQQGTSSTTRLRPATDRKPQTCRDQRLDVVNLSNLRNDLQVFRFNSQSAAFGKCGAQIVDVQLLNENGEALAWVVGGERVVLRIVAIAHENLDSPILGFCLKDRLGQVLFGDNTYLSSLNKPTKILKNQSMQAEFEFLMPILPVGDYSIATAIANGSSQEHEQHHWLHDAVVFKSESSSVATGLIGIPMISITLTAAENSQHCA